MVTASLTYVNVVEGARRNIQEHRLKEELGERLSNLRGHLCTRRNSCPNEAIGQRSRRINSMADTSTKLPVTAEKENVPQARGGGWTSFESLRREVDRLFDDFHPFGWRGAIPRLPELRTPFAGNWPLAPAMDLVEKDGEYEITAELPGADEKDIDIKVTNHVLTIKGEKSEKKEEKKKDYFLSERRYGSFQRSVQIPEGVDADKIEATFSKGILTVRLPKTAEAQKPEKTITVKAA
jgi:HSP20 family protein